MATRKFQAVLSPAIVATIVNAEQLFTVGPGDLDLDAQVSVSKPSTQAGAGCVSGRVASLTQVGITFVNPTAAGVTPTASEAYQISVTK